MRSKPQITIHYGALHDEIAVDGNEFTRHHFDRAEQTKMRGIIVGALRSVGYFEKEGR